ncbi:hypothetical protein [Streptomyces sp. NPDC088360]|uniref:hypothetical protein n=1 Tax=unclassified Streptomyces TaxID=2593676 RepID=UPI00344FFCEB
MPLPEPGASWPPPQWAPYYAEMRLDDAWYSGDRRRAQTSRPRHRLHVPLPSDIAAVSAHLLFSDMP